MTRRAEKDPLRGRGCQRMGESLPVCLCKHMIVFICMSVGMHVGVDETPESLR